MAIRVLVPNQGSAKKCTAINVVKHFAVASFWSYSIECIYTIMAEIDSDSDSGHELKIESSLPAKKRKELPL